MKSTADTWVRINGYLIELFEDHKGNDIIKIDGQNCKPGLSYQDIIAHVTKCPPTSSQGLGGQSLRYDESTLPQPVDYGRS